MKIIINILVMVFVILIYPVGSLGTLVYLFPAGGLTLLLLWLVSCYYVGKWSYTVIKVLT